MEHIKSFQSFTTYMGEVQNKRVAEEKAAKQAKYAEFFKSKLQEYGVTTPNELSEEKKAKFFEEINSWTGDKKINEGAVNEADINEADVKDEDSFKKYVYAMYKKAFGDKFDEKKADDVIAGLMKKHKGDWGAMVGAAQASLGESVVEESFDTITEAELSPLQKEYRVYFQEVLDEFGVKNQAELSEEKRKEFFNKIRAGWEKGKGRK